MPARPTRAEGAFPGRFLGLGRLPKHEVAGVVLFVLVLIDTRAGFDPANIELRQLAIVGEARDAEVRRPVAGVGVTFLCHLRDQVDHLRDVLGRQGDLFGLLQAQGSAVFIESLAVLGGVFTDRLPGLNRRFDDLVLHVGDVHDVLQDIAAPAQVASQDVLEGEGSQVADVDVVVNGRPAGVHAHRIRVERAKFFETSG